MRLGEGLVHGRLLNMKKLPILLLLLLILIIQAIKISSLLPLVLILELFYRLLAGDLMCSLDGHLELGGAGGAAVLGLDELSLILTHKPRRPTLQLLLHFLVAAETIASFYGVTLQENLVLVVSRF